MEKALKDDHFVFLTIFVDLTDMVHVILKVLHQLQMVDWKERHRGIEIFLMFVERQVHSAEVNLELGWVLFLLQDLLLLLNSQASLLLLKFLLSKTSLSFSFFVFFLLSFVDLSLFSATDRLRLTNMLKFLEFVAEFFPLTSLFGLFNAGSTENKSTSVSAIGKVDFSLKLQNVAITSENVHRYPHFRLELVKTVTEFRGHLFVHVILYMSSEFSLGPFVAITSLQALELDRHQVALDTKGARIPIVFFFVAVCLTTIF